MSSNHSSHYNHNLLLPNENIYATSSTTRGTSVCTLRDDQSFSHNSHTPDLIQFEEAPPLGIVAQRFSDFLNSHSSQHNLLHSASSSTFSSQTYYHPLPVHYSVDNNPALSSVSVQPNFVSTPFGNPQRGGEPHTFAYCVECGG